MEVTLSQPAPAAAVKAVNFRKQLETVRFPIEVRLAMGRMTVGDLLSLKPGSVVKSDGAPGDHMHLCCGRVVLAAVEPVVEEGRLLVRVEETGDGRD